MTRFRIVTCLGLLTPIVASGADWTNWRGPEGTGVSRETGLPDKLVKPLWMKKDVNCRSTPIILNGRVYAIGKVGQGETEQERVICMDAKTGTPIWDHKFNVFFTPIVSVRLGWTELVADAATDKVYAHGTQGHLFCFEGKTGRVLWEKSLTEEYGRITGYGGRVTSPVLDGDLLILGMVSSNWGSHAGGGTRFFAFDKATGEVVWTTTTGLRPSNTYRSVPAVTTINGERIFISGGADGHLHAFQVNTGKKVWSYDYGRGAMNPSPVVVGNLIYAAHGETNADKPVLGRLICVDGSKLVKNKNGDAVPTLVWEVLGIEFKHPSPIVHEDRLYVPDRQGRVYCFDAKKGEVNGAPIWTTKVGIECTGSPTYADGKIYLCSVDAALTILDAKSGRRLFRKKFSVPGFDVEAEGTPTICNGCIYFGTSEEFYCFGTYKEANVTVPPQPKAPGPNPGGKPAQLIVVPGEVALSGGESVQFKARLFDEKGRFIREAKPTWALAAMKRGAGLAPGVQLPDLQGTIDGDGKLTVPKNSKGQSGNVVATDNGLEGRARVRQVPSFPLKEDFEGMPAGTVPPGWTNTQLRFQTHKIGGNTVLKKTATIAIPFYRQWYAFIGNPDQTGYTIEADVMGQQVGTDMPNAGVTANRYILQLVGTEQKLRLTSWDAIPRVSKEMNFAWKPNQWFRMKLTVEKGANGKATVLGKVWPQGAPEPKNWTIQLSDPSPNLSGPPGLYGSAFGIQPPRPGTEIYYDNVVVK